MPPATGVGAAGTGANDAVAADEEAGAAAAGGGGGAAAGMACVGGAAGGVPVAAAAPAIGRSTLRLIGRPQLGQKRSSPLWMAAQRGQAVMPASRSTVTGWRS